MSPFKHPERRRAWAATEYQQIRARIRQRRRRLRAIAASLSLTSLLVLCVSVSLTGVDSCLNYLGGKSRLAPRIVSMIPADHVCYCEPFCGAAWVYFTKPESKVEILNDLDGELVTFWRVIQNHLQEFLRYYRHAVIAREIFDLEKRRDPTTLTDIQRAARYYYIQRLCFGGKNTIPTFGTSALGGPRLNIADLEERLLEVHWRLKRATIEHLSALECIRRYDRPSTFFYIDPPYWGTAGYSIPFADQDYQDLAGALAKVEGRFILSLNDCPQVRDTFKGFTMQRVRLSYSVGNTRTVATTRTKSRSELLISNVEVGGRAGFKPRSSGIRPVARTPLSASSAVAKSLT